MNLILSYINITWLKCTKNATVHIYIITGWYMYSNVSITILDRFLCMSLSADKIWTKLHSTSDSKGFVFKFVTSATQHISYRDRQLMGVEGDCILVRRGEKGSVTQIVWKKVFVKMDKKMFKRTMLKTHRYSILYTYWLKSSSSID